MFLVYGDESMDETQSRVCAVGGLIGTEEAWSAVEPKWKSLHGDTPFHANDCDSDQGDYSLRPGERPDEQHQRNKALYKASTILLAESNIGGFASAYDLAAQREVFPQPYSPPIYYQPFLDVLQVMRNSAEAGGETAELTFDSRLESEHNAGLIYANLRKSNPAWRDRLSEKISFASSQTNSRIQMADLFAREAMKALDNEIGPRKRAIRKSWELLRSTGRFLVCSFGRRYFAAAKRDMENLEDIFGFIGRDFQAWLKEGNRQWNVTAYFEFLQWHFNQMSPEKRYRLNDELNRWKPV